MKHLEVYRSAVERVLGWLGLASLHPTQWDELERYAVWLKGEAMVAGGIGPREADRIWTRHLADSLAFAYPWRKTGPPARLLDVGAGVGLPGIPLAVLWPDTNVTLLDRSIRRVDLARRAVRRVGLDNVSVRRGDASSESPEWEGAAFRAVFSQERACEVANAVLHPAGTAVIGLRGADTNRALGGTSMGERITRVVDVPPTVLDGTASLLIMGPSGD